MFDENMFYFDKLFLWILVTGTFIYYWITAKSAIFAVKGIPYKKPFPLFGNVFKSLFGFVPPFVDQQAIYDIDKDAPFVGMFHFMVPRLILKDPELIEQVLVTDFSSANERVNSGPGGQDDGNGLTAHLLAMSGKRWKSLRSKLSPVFSSGKLKSMIEQLVQCSDRLSEYINKEIASGKPLEVKYVMSGYTLDVIGTCAFGLEFNTINNPNSVLRKLGDMVFSPSKARFFLNYIYRKFPIIAKIIKFFRPSPPVDTQQYINELVANTVKYRESNNLKRNDFVQLMMEIRDQDKTKTPDENEVLMDDRVMASNSLVFLLAGYETTATTLAFMLYELAVNQKAQERLYEEIVEALKKHDGEITWECLKDMTYLQQVLSETLRKYPAATTLTRVVRKPILFKKYNFVAPEGLPIQVPVYSLHHDPKYYPDPNKFDPERFSEANKQKLVKSTYLPFGDGPRMCIGMRFAILEIKTAVTKLLLDFSVSLDPKTLSPLQYNPGTFLLSPVGGIWINFIPRKINNIS